MLIANERIKFFTVSGATAKAADRGNVQQTTGYKLKLTQAGANYVNRALQASKALQALQPVRHARRAPDHPAGGGRSRRPGVRSTPGPAAARPARATPRRLGHHRPGPHRPDPRRRLRHAADPGGRHRPRRRRQGRRRPSLPLEGVDVDLGLRDRHDQARRRDHPRPARRSAPSVELVNPEIVLGPPDAAACTRTSTACGSRSATSTPTTLDINLLDGTVTIKQLHVNLGGGLLNDVLAPVLGTLGIPASTPILNLDLSFPDL